MRLGLQIPDFTFPNGAAGLGPDLAAIARRRGPGRVFEYLAVMDHFFQIRGVGRERHARGVQGARLPGRPTERVKLLTVMTGALYRYPAVLAKAVTTLDVLSGGRAVLGIGAGWTRASPGLGIPFPPVSDSSAGSRNARTCAGSSAMGERLHLLQGKRVPSGF